MDQPHDVDAVGDVAQIMGPRHRHFHAVVVPCVNQRMIGLAVFAQRSEIPGIEFGVLLLDILILHREVVHIGPVLAGGKAECRRQQQSNSYFDFSFHRSQKIYSLTNFGLQSHQTCVESLSPPLERSLPTALFRFTPLVLYSSEG